LVTPPVTVTRSCSEKVDRCSDTGVMLRFEILLSLIGRGLNVTPSGSRTPSAPCQPVRWKSEIMITSRRGSVDSLAMLPASFSAGPYRVAPAPGLPVPTAAVNRLRSGVDLSATSAADEKKTIDARSDGPIWPIAVRASCVARLQRSP
jgi:hypothetical protein